MASIMDQVARLDVRMKSRDEIVAYFKREYPGAKVISTKDGTKSLENWKGPLSERLMQFTRAKNGGPQTKASIMRRFQNRGAKSWEDIKPSARQREEYEALGKTLPGQPPALGYRVDGPVCIGFPSGPCEERIWNHKVIGENRLWLHRTADLGGLINVYMGQLWDTDEPEAWPCEEDEEDDCNTKLKITALSQDEADYLPNLDGGL